MVGRREILLDAAIRVLGERGIRALTHRAVDVEAGLGVGSTTNYFPTRESLLAGIVVRFAERERQNFEDLAITVVPTSPLRSAELSAQPYATPRAGTAR